MARKETSSFIANLILCVSVCVKTLSFSLTSLRSFVSSSRGSSRIFFSADFYSVGFSLESKFKTLISSVFFCFFFRFFFRCAQIKVVRRNRWRRPFAVVCQRVAHYVDPSKRRSKILSLSLSLSLHNKKWNAAIFKYRPLLSTSPVVMHRFFFGSLVPPRATAKKKPATTTNKFSRSSRNSCPIRA